MTEQDRPDRTDPHRRRLRRTDLPLVPRQRSPLGALEPDLDEDDEPDRDGQGRDRQDGAGQDGPAQDDDRRR